MTKSKTMLNTPPNQPWVGYFILKGVVTIINSFDTLIKNSKSRRQ
ncbi:hypothetical protein [Nostoc sp.]